MVFPYTFDFFTSPGYESDSEYKSMAQIGVLCSCHICDILSSIVPIVYVNSSYFGKLPPNYSPIITFIFLLQLLFIYFARLNNISQWIFIVTIISTIGMAGYFLFDIFFAGFFYHGFALHIIFMMWLVISDIISHCLSHRP